MLKGKGLPILSFREMLQEMIQMIKNNKMFLDLPEDWKKIIRILKDGPASREEIVKRCYRFQVELYP